MAHLYNSGIRKVAWFIRRFGFKELWLKPLRILFSPIILARLKTSQFTFQNRTLTCLYHPYNTTWANERCVEIPIIRSLLCDCPDDEILEIGNVLPHYGPGTHPVIDKYERGERVVNKDILEFQPGRQFHRVISISTFEHIGFDDTPAGHSASKIIAAIQTCIQWLAPCGNLIITVPVGYNPELDRLIRDTSLGAAKESYLHRTGASQWTGCDKAIALQHQYGTPFPYANSIMVAEFLSSQAPGPHPSFQSQPLPSDTPRA